LCRGFNSLSCPQGPVSRPSTELLLKVNDMVTVYYYYEKDNIKSIVIQKATQVEIETDAHLLELTDDENNVIAGFNWDRVVYYTFDVL
jgi:hypothetical protein